MVVEKENEDEERYEVKIPVEKGPVHGDRIVHIASGGISLYNKN